VRLKLSRRRSGPRARTQDGSTCDGKGPGAIRIRPTLGGDAGSYGNPVLERWRPGGSVLAVSGQGSQADLSLPPGCPGVSRQRQGIGPWTRAWESARKNGMTRDLGESRAKVSPRPSQRKVASVTKPIDESRVPEVRGESRHPSGVLTRHKGSGVVGLPQLTAVLCRRPPPRGDNITRLMRCPEAARLKWTARNQVRL